MRYLALLVCMLFSGGYAFSQTEIEYLDQDFGKLPGNEGAVYVRNTQYEDKKKNSKIVQINYLTGEKVSAYRSVRTGNGNFLYEGLFQKWHKNGQLFYSVRYQRGRKEGEALGYYASGKLKRKETFVMDFLQKGECFNEDGTPVGYFPHEANPEFPGGAVMMSNYLRQNVKYPAEAMRNGKQGLVSVRFTVDELGKINHIEIVDRVDPVLDAEALRVVQNMPDFKPAKEEGVSKAFVYDLPISFRLASPNLPKSGDSRFPSDRNEQKLNRRF